MMASSTLRLIKYTNNSHKIAQIGLSESSLLTLEAVAFLCTLQLEIQLEIEYLRFVLLLAMMIFSFRVRLYRHGKSLHAIESPIPAEGCILQHLG